MPSAAVIVYVEPKVVSNYTQWCLEPVGGEPLLVRFFKRVSASLPLGDYLFIVATPENGFTARLREAFRNTNVELAISQETGRLRTLCDVLRSRPTLKTVLLFPEESLFPDCQMAQEMVRLHRAKHMEGTVCQDAAPGLVPEVYEASALQRLLQLGLPEELDSDFAGIMEKANALFEEEPAMRFKLQNVTTQSVGGPELASLPVSLLIDDGNARRAAEVVLGAFGSKTSLRDFYALYKDQLRTINAETQFTFAVPSPTDSRIRIIFTTKFGGFTGGQECFYNLISHLDPSRYSPVVLLPFRGVLSEKLTAAGIPVEITYFDSDLLTPWTLRYYAAFLKHTRAQILHVDGDPAGPLVTSAFHAGIPYIYHLQQFVGRKATPLISFAARVITDSQAVGKDILSSDVDPKRVITIFEGVNVDGFHPERHNRAKLRVAAGIPEDTPVITMIARISPQKRLDLLIKALPTVLKKVPNALVLFVGECFDKEASYRAEVLELIRTLKLADHVRFWGFEKNIVHIHALSDVLVNCSTNEPVGHSILEALAMRVPVVAPNRGGHTEILKDNHNSLIFNGGSHESLAIELIRLLTTPGLPARLAAEGRNTAEKLDIAQYARQVEAVYETLLP